MFRDAPAVMREAGRVGQADRIERCLDADHRRKCKVVDCDRCRQGRSGDALVLRCEGAGGTRHVQCVAVRCGHRLCAACAPLRSKRLLREYDYADGVQRFRTPVLITLTVRNLAELFREDLLRLKRAFGDLRRRSVWRGHDCHAACCRPTKREREAGAVARACPARGGNDRCRSSCLECPRKAEHDRCPACGCVGRRRHVCTSACQACPREKVHGLWHAAECGEIYQPTLVRADGTVHVGATRRCRCPGEHPGVPAGLLSLEVTATEHAFNCPARPLTKKEADGNLRRGAVRGACVGGCTPSWHPHLHVVADSSRWISAYALGEAWRECATRRGFAVGDFPAHVNAIKPDFARRRADGRAAHPRARSLSQALTYAVKYAAKGDLPELEARRLSESEEELAARRRRHRTRFAVRYALAIENVRLVQSFGNLRARRYHSPGVPPVCLACVKLLEERDRAALDALVRPIHALASECECSRLPAEQGRNCPRCLAPPTSPDVLAPSERVRQHLHTFLDAWPTLLDFCPRDRVRKRTWIASYLRNVYGMPICAWRSEGLLSSLARRVTRGDPDVDDHLLAFVAEQLEGVRVHAEAIAPSVADLCDPALDETVVRS